MSVGGNAGAAAAAAAIAQATKASGVIVRIGPEDFLHIVELNDEPLVVHARGGFFSVKHQYLTSYRGLAFFAQASEPISIPAHCPLVEAQKIWIPG
jgi:hypothetical protein